MEQMAINNQGGKQHKEEFRCQAIPPKALIALGNSVAIPCVLQFMKGIKSELEKHHGT